MVTSGLELLSWVPEQFRAHGGYQYQADRHDNYGPGGTVIRLSVFGWGSCSCGAEFGTQDLPLPPEEVTRAYLDHLPEGFIAWREAYEQWRLDQIRDHPYRIPGWPPVGWDDDPPYRWHG